MKVIVDNIATEYEDQGTGPVLLMLHGWKDTLHTFDALVPSLTSNFRIVRLDLPGFGKTELPRLTWDLDDYIHFLASFLKKIECSPDYMLGHSFGARVIIKGVSEHTFVPKKIVLISAAGVTKKRYLRSTIYKVIAKIGKFFTAIPLLSRFRPILRRNLYNSAGSDYLDAGLLKETYLRVINEDLSNRVSNIAVPTYLIWGSEDSSTPVSDAQFLENEMKNAQLQVFEGNSHFVHQEEHEKISQAIKEFLK
ncbi:MAG: alpha/beta hydrolase [Candidatus Doudnabacteria bacterium]|nr:alpha/beta hydrolase [Candidatus Doudnabacteria bacterium]